MKSSGIGGQAVIEGIMMRNKQKYSIAVRKPDNEIEVIVKESKMLTEKYPWLDYPVIRGVFNFFDSMVSGVSTISYSASFYDDPAEQKTTKADEIGKAIFKDKLEGVLMALTIVFSVFFAVGLFMVLPYFISRLLSNVIASKFLLNFFEGVIRVLIFILYIWAISKMNDIKRTFMYHGAEHKCINCIENGAQLNVENVRNSSRFHKRCGTSFLFLVMFISIIFFIFIRVDNTALQVVIRLLLIPVIAGVSYEVIRWAGRSDNAFVNVISQPGMWLQRMTTKEPDDAMIEVAIQAVESVFDWKAFMVEYYKDSDQPDVEMQSKAEELALASDLVMNTQKTTRTLTPEQFNDKERQERLRKANREEVLQNVQVSSVTESEDLSLNHNEFSETQVDGIEFFDQDANQDVNQDAIQNIDLNTSQDQDILEQNHIDTQNQQDAEVASNQVHVTQEEMEEEIEDDDDLPDGFEFLDEEPVKKKPNEEIQRILGEEEDTEEVPTFREK